MSRLNNGTGTFIMSGSSPDMGKVSDACHRSRRTSAMASAKVGRDLAYQAAERGIAGRSFRKVWAACQGYPGEESEQDWCCPGNGKIGPLTLGLHS